LEGVTTNLCNVQAVLLSKFSAETILIGHSLESDFKALKLLHSTVIDTSVVFPHKLGKPYKRALRALAADFLKRIIQNDGEKRIEVFSFVGKDVFLSPISRWPRFEGGRGGLHGSNEGQGGRGHQEVEANGQIGSQEEVTAVKLSQNICHSSPR